jgi:hypothetical protein
MFGPACCLNEAQVLQSELMRKLLSIWLLAALILPIVAPLLALGQDADAGLPACCRKNGKHHCMMSAAKRQALEGSDARLRWTAPMEECPCCPAGVVATHPSVFAVIPARGAFVGIVSEPAKAVQAECKRRIARDRSRQKRGPPRVALA